MKIMESMKTRIGLPILASAGLVVAGCHCGGEKAATTQPAYTGGAGEEQTSATTTGNTVIPLYQEQVNVGTREVQDGQVHLKKVVKTETVNQPVQLRSEQLVIEREPASGQAAAPGGEAFTGQEITIPLKHEVPVVEKSVTSAGQVVVRTQSTQTQTNIMAEVRKEDVAVSPSDQQNVIIGQGIQSAGGGESPSGQNYGAGGNVITDPAQCTSGDAATLSGRQVQFSGLKVDRVIGDRVVVLDAGNGQKLYALPSQAPGCKPGDRVTVTGTLRQSSNATGLSGDAAQTISSQPIYVDAQRIDVQ